MTGWVSVVTRTNLVTRFVYSRLSLSLIVRTLFSYVGDTSHAYIICYMQYWIIDSCRIKIDQHEQAYLPISPGCL